MCDDTHKTSKTKLIANDDNYFGGFALAA